MSGRPRSPLSDVEELSLKMPCSYCGVAAGTWCKVTTTGERAITLHNDRVRLIRDAYHRGWFRGEHESFMFFIDQPARFAERAKRYVLRRAS